MRPLNCVFRYRRQLLDRAFNRSEADRKEERRLTAELAAISKQLTAVQKDVKSRYGLEDEIEAAFDIQNEVEVSKMAQLPSYVYVVVVIGTSTRLFASSNASPLFMLFCRHVCSKLSQEVVARAGIYQSQLIAHSLFFPVLIHLKGKA